MLLSRRATPATNTPAAVARDNINHGGRQQAGPPPQAKGEFKTAVGETVGNVTMTQMSDGTVMVSVAVRGLPPGQHGIHIHAVGSCTPTFAAAGPHYNPAQKQHGLDNPNGPHAGDLPNLTMGASGAGTFTAMTNRVTITGGPNTIFDSDGSALVIHALVDDQKTDPAGNSGDRIACAVVQPGTPAGAQAGGQTSGQTGAGQPSRLPTTGGAETPWLALIAGALLLCVGALAVHRARARG